MKDNKLIAEFMGDIPKYVIGNGKAYNKYKDYSKSWDWLMPVVEKIMWDNDIEDNQCTNIEEALCDAKIDRVYDAVVTFITEHNKNLEYESFNEAPYGEQ